MTPTPAYPPANPERDSNGVIVPDGWELTRTFAPPCATCGEAGASCGAVIGRALAAEAYDEEGEPTATFPARMADLDDCGPWNRYLRWRWLNYLQRQLQVAAWIAVGQFGVTVESDTQGDGVINWSEQATLTVTGGGTKTVQVLTGDDPDPKRLALLSGGHCSIGPGDFVWYPHTGRMALVRYVNWATGTLYLTNDLGIDTEESDVLIWASEPIKADWREMREPQVLWCERDSVTWTAEEVAAGWNDLHAGKIATPRAWRWQSGQAETDLDTPTYKGTFLVLETRGVAVLNTTADWIDKVRLWIDPEEGEAGVYTAQIDLTGLSEETDSITIHFCPAIADQSAPGEDSWGMCADRCKHSSYDPSGTMATVSGGRMGAATDGNWFCAKAWAQNPSEEYDAFVAGEFGQRLYSADCMQTACPYYEPYLETTLTEARIDSILMGRGYYVRQLTPSGSEYRIGRVQSPGMLDLCNAFPDYDDSGLYLPHFTRYGKAYGALISKPSGEKAENEGAVQIVRGGFGILSASGRVGMDGEALSGNEARFPVRRPASISVTDWQARPVGPSENHAQEVHVWRLVWPRIDLQMPVGAKREIAQGVWAQRLAAPVLRGEGESEREYALELWFYGLGATYADEQGRVYTNPGIDTGATYIEGLDVAVDRLSATLYFRPTISTFWDYPDPPEAQQAPVVVEAAVSGKTVAVGESRLVTNPGCRDALSKWGSQTRLLHPGMTVRITCDTPADIPAAIRELRLHIISVSAMQGPEYDGDAIDIETEPSGPGIPAAVISDRLKMDAAVIDLANPSGATFAAWLDSESDELPAGARIIPEHAAGFARTQTGATAAAGNGPDPSGGLDALTIGVDNEDVVVDTRRLLVASDALEPYEAGRYLCLSVLARVMDRAPAVSGDAIEWLIAAAGEALEWVELDGLTLGDSLTAICGTDAASHPAKPGGGSIAYWDTDLSLTVTATGTGTAFEIASDVGWLDLEYFNTEVTAFATMGFVAIAAAGALNRIPSTWISEARFDIKCDGYSLTRTDIQVVSDVPQSSETTEDSGPLAFGLFTLQGTGSTRSLGEAVLTFAADVEADKWATVDATALVKFLIDHPDETFYLAAYGAQDVTELDGTKQYTLVASNTTMSISWSGDTSSVISYYSLQGDGIDFRGMKIKLDWDAVMADAPEIFYSSGLPTLAPAISGEPES